MMDGECSVGRRVGGFVLDERTGADVASFLGISEANVRVIRHRAIRQLRDCMGGGA